MSKQEEKKRATVDRCCDPTSESENTDEDDVSIKDELIRRDVQVLTARLYDLRERFMKIVHKINDDAKDFQDSTSEEDGTSDSESSEDMSIDKKSNESTATLSNDKENETLKVPSKPQAHLIDSILQIISVKHKYLRYIDQYPSIVHYLIDDDPQDSSIPLRHLEPFIIAHVQKEPTSEDYDVISRQVEEIRAHYLNHQQ